MDVLYPKIFLHTYIYNKLQITYGNIRKKVLNDRLIYFPQQIIYYGFKFLTQLTKKFVKRLQNKTHKPSSSQHITSENDLYKLREILGHKEGVVERFFLKNINDYSCKKYLNYLYDCIELKVNSSNISSTEGMQLCRLVNLQIMMTKKKEDDLK